MLKKFEIIQKLQHLKTKDPLGKKPIYYRGNRQDLPFYDIDLNLLRFNPLNDRIHTDIKEYEQTTGMDFNLLPITKMNTIISEMIWSKHESKNKKTLEDIKRKNQLEVGVVTKDGLIVDGNRRFMLLLKINEESSENRPFRAIILDETYDDDPTSKFNIKLLEMDIQDGEDTKEDYSAIDKYIRVINFVDQYIESVSKKADYTLLAKKLKTTEKNIKERYEIGKMMQRYLEYIECPNLYSRLKNTEELFKKLYSTHHRIASGGGKTPWTFDKINDAQDYESIGFDLIRWGYNPKADTGKWTTSRNLREIYFKDSDENTVFSNKNVWTHFKERIIDFQENKENKEKSIDEIATERNLTTIEAAEARDIDWAQKISPVIKEALGKAESKINDLKNRDYPDKIISQSLDKLINLIDEDDFKYKDKITYHEKIIKYISEDEDKDDIIKNLHSIRRISEGLIREC